MGTNSERLQNRLKHNSIKRIENMTLNYINCISFLILFFVSNGFSTDLVMTCPNEFTDGEISNINCTINHASIFADGCKLNTLNVQFILGSTSDTVCYIDRPPACSNTLLPGQLPGSSCGCIKASGDEYTYQLLFPANKSLHQGKKLRCSSCYPTTNVTEMISGSCNSITFKDTPGQSDTNNGTTGNLTPGQKAGIAIGVIVGTAIIIIIITLLIYHFACGYELCGRQGYTPCCRPAGKEKKESSIVQPSENHLSEAHPMRHPE